MLHVKNFEFRIKICTSLAMQYSFRVWVIMTVHKCIFFAICEVPWHLLRHIVEKLPGVFSTSLNSKLPFYNKHSNIEGPVYLSILTITFRETRSIHAVPKGKVFTERNRLDFRIWTPIPFSTTKTVTLTRTSH